MEIVFDKNAAADKAVEKIVREFLDSTETLEKSRNVPIFIFQDGVKKSYYIRCAVTGKTMADIVSLDARLNPESGETYRGNREILESHNTFRRMRADAENEREFNDIIAEYIHSYEPKKPLKIWGGQHRSRAIIDAYHQKKVSRYHGFRVYFDLSKEQRIELAMISNTSIAVSNDLHGASPQKVVRQGRPAQAGRGLPGRGLPRRKDYHPGRPQLYRQLFQRQAGRSAGHRCGTGQERL
jgi:hypothetical protein